MTSKIVVNNIEADTGVSTVTFNSNVVRGGSNLHSTGLNVNNTFVHSTGIALGAGSTIGAVTGVTTYYGDGSQLTGISVDTTKIETGNTKVETIDTGSDGHVKVTTEGSERLRITSDGKLGVNTTAPVETVGIAGSMRFITANGTKRMITALPSGSYATSVSGGAAIGFERIADGGGGSDEIYFETHWQGNRHGESMRINKKGHVTKPEQPSFEASYPDGYTSSGVSHHITTWLRVHHNIGSHFNASNGRFTAPVDGRYLFSVHMTNVGHASPHIAFTINDGSYAAGPSRSGTDYTETWHISEGSGGGVNLTHIFDLSANDYVRASTWNYTGTGDDPRCYFCGYLLG